MVARSPVFDYLSDVVGDSWPEYGLSGKKDTFGLAYGVPHGFLV
jgi:hypothetical protein